MQEGYYFVVKYGMTMIARYLSSGFWQICGSEDYFNDSYWEKIGEKIVI